MNTTKAEIAAFYWVPLIPACLLSFWLSLYELGTIRLVWGFAGWPGNIDDTLTLLTFPFCLLAFVSQKIATCLLWLSFATHFVLLLAENWSNTPHVHFGVAGLVMILGPSFTVAMLSQIAYMLKKLT